MLIPVTHFTTFLPTYIPNCFMWLDADYAPSFSLGYGGTINSWTDRSANGRVFTPVNATDPYYLVRIQKPNWKNRNVVCTQLNSSTGLSCPAYDVSLNFAANGTDITVFAVFRSDEAVFGSASIYYQVSTIGHYLRAVNSGTTGRFFAAGASLSLTSADFLYSEKVVCVQRNGTTGSAWINGATETTGTATPTAIVAGTSTPLYIGASTAAGGGMHGDLAELIIYNRVLTTLERQAVENYLAAKWLVGVV